MALAEAIEDANIAFDQLEFSIRLLTFCEMGNLDPKRFDDNHIVKLPDGDLNYPAGKFATQNRLVSAASINVLTAAGVTALALHRTFEEAGIPADPTTNDPIGMLRCLVYMVRNAFAHDMGSPQWVVRGQFQRQLTLQLENGAYQIDLSPKDGQALTMDDIGGYTNWYRIYRASMAAITPAKQPVLGH